MNALDIGILIIIFASGLIGLIRGLTSEVLSLVSWVGAGAASYFGFPLVRDIAQGYIERPVLADGVSIIVIFIVFLILLSVLSHTLSNFVKGSVLGSIDRSLGLAFGLTRGFIVLCAADIVLGMLISRSNPPLMVQQSRFSPLISKSSETFVHLLPHQIKDYVTTRTLKQ
ncbi:MAG: CvpA family protein, partial [Proteobacteria bacterium]|nr:CvpA family protein [Pseudomonadota bacterium]